MRKDITGQKFGKLTAIALNEEKTKEKKFSIWHCKCECGNEVDVYLGNLTRLHTRSCGCLYKDIGEEKREDLTGQKFGRLTVVEYDPEHSKTTHRSAWKYQCECGAVLSRTAHDLKTGLKDGQIQSCGCYVKEFAHKTRFKDLTGQRFGKLTCIDWFTNDNGRTWWNCQCDCGGKIATAADRLLRGQTQSCGCYKGRSIGEENIAQILREHNIEYSRGYNFLECRYRYFDFYLPQYNRLIEFDGIQHYEEVEAWESRDNLSSRQNRDKEKNKYAVEHNIELIRIPYWERDQITLDMLLGDQYLIIDEEGNYKNFTRQEMLSKNG